MRAIVKSNVQRDVKMALIQVDESLLPMFTGRLLVSTLPAEYKDTPDGALPPAEHEIASDPRLQVFFRQKRVIAAAGGVTSLEAFLGRLNECQYQSKNHSKHFVTSRYGDSALRLCESCDNRVGSMTIPKLDDIANANIANFVVATAKRRLRTSGQLTTAELAFWAITHGVYDLLPETFVAELMEVPSPELVTGTVKESDITHTPAPSEIMAKKVKAAKVFKVDTEVPGAFMLRPKRTRAEDSKYTRWVKTRPCSGCGERSDDPHHIIGHGQGGMGTKAHDFFTIPLCRKCHDALHKDPDGWEAEHGSQIQLWFEFMDFSFGIGAIA